MNNNNNNNNNNIDTTRCNNNSIIVIPISSTCFGRWFRPSSGALDCDYSLWYNAPTMLRAGSLDAVEPLPDYQPVTSWVHYTTSCKHSLVFMRMGEIIVRNMLSWLELLINLIVESSWLFVLFLSVMHGHTNIKCDMKSMHKNTCYISAAFSWFSIVVLLRMWNRRWYEARDEKSQI